MSESNHITHFRTEIRILKKFESVSADLETNLLSLLQAFANQGHSGFSARYCINAFKSLALAEAEDLVQAAQATLISKGYKPLAEEEEGPNKWIQENLYELLTTFSAFDFSQNTKKRYVKLFTLLADFQPLAPLTGEASEWEDHGLGRCQNKRCSHVFKDPNLFNGQAFDIDGKIFREPSGACYTNRSSFVPVQFPYTPTSVYIDVPEPEPEPEPIPMYVPEQTQNQEVIGTTSEPPINKETDH